METLNIETALEKIKQAAKHMPEVRVIKSMAVGQVVRQGDIYIERVKAIEGKGASLKSRQLAPGTTKGSRHIVDESPEVMLWASKPKLKDKAAFQVGPAIEALRPFSITHPEHATCRLPAGTYQVYFQADFARKERAKD